MSDDASPAPERLARTLSTFADRVFRTGGSDPGDAALPLAPERLEIYRSLVSKNQRLMLRFVFTQTLRLVEHDAEEGRGPEGGVGRIAERCLEVAPAATHSTREIADRFLAFLPAEHPELFERHPALAELMALERAELDARYGADDPGRTPAAEELAALAAQPVAAFLALSVLRSGGAATFRLAHATATWRHEIEHRRFQPAGPGPQFALVCRDPATGDPAVHAVDEDTVAALEQLAPGEAASVEELADRWLAALPAARQSAPEEELFPAFARAVIGALAAGALRLRD